MSKYLVIVESPSKVSKIKSFLGPDYDVTASVGHIRDLLPNKISVDIKKNFTPTYDIYPDKKEVVKNIISKAKKSQLVYLLTDDDREGSGIAFHIVQILPENIPYKRARSGSITKNAILEGIKNASDIDKDLVDAYETRRILDRLAGYKTSFIVKQSTGGPSAGRVQTAALHILAERERVILAFVPQIYYPVEAELLTEKMEKIIALIKNPKPLDIKTKEQADEICVILKKGPVKVSKYEQKQQSVHAYAPFKTSTMIQAASSVFGWKTARTTKAAQNLYSSGKVTYIRTDSTYIVPDFVNDMRTLIPQKYGSTYLPAKPNHYSNLVNAQEAHEAIRPTDLNVHMHGQTDEDNLYDLIYKRTVASQMSDMQRLNTIVEFSCEKNVLGASANSTMFDGWRKCYDFGSLEESSLPILVVGDTVRVIDLKIEKKQTQPPPRFTEATFNQQLEKSGIGRPSTYKTIPVTLEERKYIESKKNIIVTELGLRVDDFMQQVGFCFADVEFTAQLEEKLDKIAKAELKKLDVLNEFWTRLKTDIDKAKIIRDTIKKTNHICPQCKTKKTESFLVLRHSKYGPFYSCETYNSKTKQGCEYKADVGENGEPVEKQKNTKIIEYSDILCPKCGSKLIKRKNKNDNIFLGCSQYRQGCTGIYKEDGTPIEFKKKNFRSKKSDKGKD